MRFGAPWEVEVEFKSAMEGLFATDLHFPVSSLTLSKDVHYLVYKFCYEFRSTVFTSISQGPGTMLLVVPGMSYSRWFARTHEAGHIFLVEMPFSSG